MHTCFLIACFGRKLYRPLTYGTNLHPTLALAQPGPDPNLNPNPNVNVFLALALTLT